MAKLTRGHPVVFISKIYTKNTQFVREKKEDNDDYFTRYEDYNFIFTDFLVSTKHSLKGIEYNHIYSVCDLWK